MTQEPGEQGRVQCTASSGNSSAAAAAPDPRLLLARLLLPPYPDVCRICWEEARPEDPLVQPCSCRGTAAHIHASCLRQCERVSPTPGRCTTCGSTLHWRGAAPWWLSQLNWRYLRAPALHLLLGIATVAVAAADAQHRQQQQALAAQRRVKRQIEDVGWTLGLSALAGAALAVAKHVAAAGAGMRRPPRL